MDKLISTFDSDKINCLPLQGMDEFEYNEKFERKLMILAAAGMKVVVLRPKDLERIGEIIV